MPVKEDIGDLGARMYVIFDYYYQWTAALLIPTIIFLYSWVRPRFGLSASLLLGACLYSAIFTWCFKDNRYISIDFYNQTALRYFACDSAAKIMIILIPMMLFADKRLSMLFTGEILASLFVVGNSLASLYQRFKLGECNGLTCGGLVGNPSISMGIMVCMLPIFVRSWRQWPILLLASLAVFASKSSVAVGLLAAYAVLFFVPKTLKLNPISWVFGTFLVEAGAAIVLIFGTAKYAVGKELLNDSDRFMIWKFMWDRWRAPGNLLTGTGLGTYHVIGINLQNFLDPDTGKLIHQVGGQMHWVTLHNDFLQMLFECGVIGLFLLFSTYCAALFKVVREKEFGIAISIVLYGLYMCMDPALHNPVPVLFGAWLFTYALRQNNTFKEYA